MSGEADLLESAVALPSFRLDGRLAVITGASEGIGSIFAQAFALAGALPVLASRRPEKLEEVQRSIAARGGRAEIFAFDVRDIDAIKRLADRAESIARREDLDIVLVNNAGFAFTKRAIEVTENEYDTLLDTHLKGTFFACQQVARPMIERGYGKIVNLASAWAGSSDLGKSIYSAAKAGIVRLTAGLATEWAPQGLRVNALAPTSTLTAATRRTFAGDEERAARLLSRIPLGRYALPADLIGAALFLASPASDFVTGQTLFVDGGWSAR